MKKFLAVTLCVVLAGCVFIRKEMQVHSIDTRVPATVSTPVKAHLHDGSTIVYATGVAVTADALVGRGMRHDVLMSKAVWVDRVPLADVLGLESYRTRTDAGTSVLISTLASAGGVVGGVLLAVAIFGSCPTVYSSDGAVEEAELFSTSIAPLFEGRDVDRLHARANASGIVSLEIRNEAMETHYINHLELLAVEHAADEIVVPDAKGSPVAIKRPAPPPSITSRSGRNVAADMAAAGGGFYLTERVRLDAAVPGDMDDWLDLTVPVEPDATSAALVFRMRNSLLNTTLLYEVMLAPAGAAAIDWLGGGLAQISTAVELGRWHQRRAGLHVSVFRDGRYEEVARIPDSGPISWRDVAAVVPVRPGERALKVRLSFLADHWRIDQIAVSSAVRTPTVRQVPLASVTNRRGTMEREALARLRAPDEEYLQTTPGQAFVVRFDAGTARAATANTFLLSSQGYYIEWIRGAWIRNATRSEPFLPSDAAVIEAIRKWSVKRDTFERDFRRARVAVR